MLCKMNCNFSDFVTKMPDFCRAYRLHRKRLARIVADQWMHVARHVLDPIRFLLLASLSPSEPDNVEVQEKTRKEYTKSRFCITEWKNVVERKARMSQIFERADVLCRFLMERRSFYKWKQVYHRNRVLADAFGRTVHMVRCKQLVIVLTAFQNHSQAKILGRNYVVEAERFHMLHVLKMCCSQWLSHVQERLLKLELNTRARKKWTNSLLKSVVSVWKQAMLLEKAAETDRSEAKNPDPQAEVNEFDQIGSPAPENPILQTQILNKFFWCWYLLVSQKKAADEESGERSLILVVRHYDRNLQRTAYDAWKKFASQSRLARSFSEQFEELDAVRNIRHQSETLQCYKASRRLWGTGLNENARAFSELLKQKYYSTRSRKEWVIRQNDYATAKKDLLEQMYCSTGSRKVWTIGLNEYTKDKSEVLKLMYCSKSSSREVAVSWFVMSLAKRFLCIWKEQVLNLKQHRQNHWYAIVHSKMQYLLKGLHALRENVDAKQSKLSLQEFSVNCYHQNLKRKTVSGYKFLHQTKRVKLVQIEQATAQWRTAKLQERFEKWYFATALRSMRRKQQQKSVNFRNRQLLLHAFQAWRDVKGLSKEKRNLKMAQLSRLKGRLGKFKQFRVLSSWKSLRKEMNIKKFNEARALQFFIGFRAAPVVKALYVHMQEQKLKRSLLAKAANFQNVRLLKLGIRTWSEYVLLKNFSQLAANHRRDTLLKYAMKSLTEWHQPHVEFKDMEEDHELQKTVGLSRGLHAWDTQNNKKSAPAARAQPRRPAFLYDDVAHTQEQNVQGLKNGEDRRSSGGGTPRDPNLVAKEIEWMEQVLLDYEELKMHIVRRRAELALQLEQSIPGIHDGFDQQDKNILFLRQEISSLEAKKMVQRPLIHAVLSRVQDLQTRSISDT